MELLQLVLGDGKRAAIGQIAMASFKNPEGLTDIGGNYCKNSSNSGAAVYKTGKIAATELQHTDNSSRIWRYNSRMLLKDQM